MKRQHDLDAIATLITRSKLFYEGGYAVWVTDRGTVRFYDETGGLLKSVAGVGAAGRGKAA
jgi:hypothetical protein